MPIDRRFCPTRSGREAKPLRTSVRHANRLRVCHGRSALGTTTTVARLASFLRRVVAVSKLADRLARRPLLERPEPGRRTGGQVEVGYRRAVLGQQVLAVEARLARPEDRAEPPSAPFHCSSIFCIASSRLPGPCSATASGCVDGSAARTARRRAPRRGRRASARTPPARGGRTRSPPRPASRRAARRASACGRPRSPGPSRASRRRSARTPSTGTR